MRCHGEHSPELILWAEIYITFELQHHPKTKIAFRLTPFLVLDLWDKNTGICTGAMPYRRDFTVTTGIYAFQADKCMILPANVFLAWLPRTKCRGPRRGFNHAEILVLTGTAGAGGMAPPASTRISARLECFRDTFHWCMPAPWHYIISTT